MKELFGKLIDIMALKFSKNKTISILNQLETPEEAQELLDWMKQQDIMEITEPMILKKIHKIQKK